MSSASRPSATRPPPALAAFFAHAGAFLVRGEGSAEAVESALGPSPSGTARLALYATLVERQQLEALASLFPATRRALDAIAAGTFHALATDYARAHRSPIAHPGGLGAGFPEFVGARFDEVGGGSGEAARGGSAVRWGRELADAERVRYELATSSAPLPQEGFDPVFALRRYAHAVHLVTEEAPIPEERGVSLLFARDPRTLRVRWLELGPAELVALGVVTGEYDATVADTLGLAEADLERARGRLRAVGWLR